MNTPQRILLSSSLAIIILLCLRPPYQWEHSAYLINRKTGVLHQVEGITENIGHCWIWRPPVGWEEAVHPNIRKFRVAVIDWPRLGVYVGLVVLAALGLTGIMKRRRAKEER